MHPLVRDIQQFFIDRGLPADLAPLMPYLLAILAIYIVIFALRYVLLRAKLIKWQTASFYLFVSPWIIGFVLFTLGPMLFSLNLSLYEWDIIHDAKWVGLQNYTEAFGDRRVLQSLQVTFAYALFSVPLNLVTGFSIALLMNLRLRGMRVFRTIYYLPALVGGIPQAVLFTQLLARDGIFNQFLALFGIEGPAWVTDSDFILLGVVIMSLWGAGGGMIIYLAGLADIPEHLYEAAEIDGANAVQKLRFITIPQMSPILFFNLVTGIIGAMQTFDVAFAFGGDEGGRRGALRFFVFNLWENAFRFFNTGYASALAWILFVIILVLTLLVFRSSSLWVFYEAEMKKDK
jgi:multiple sugar transport system permease protein